MNTSLQVGTNPAVSQTRSLCKYPAIAISTSMLYWVFPPGHWGFSASEILNKQSLEEDIQKSMDALSMPSAENQPWWPTLLWKKSASEILNEQGAEEAQ
ncbi:hypothetical protein OG21DRAFT_446680 [Imleria badia]|nr:hypothetical protein OG21DRAFT_446680 [Imleria badia]